MRGGSFLRRPLPKPVRISVATDEAQAIDRLHAARTADELKSVWDRDCERYRGAERERLQDEYAVALGLLGALHP